MIRGVGASALAILVASLCGCAHLVDGPATWPGARLERSILTGGDLPAGVHYERIVEQPGEPDGAGGMAAMPSRSEGCSDGLTRVLAASAERGAGSAITYVVSYDGVRMVMTVDNSVYSLFENVGNAAVIGAAFLTPNPTIAVKATLPQTFLDAAVRQVDRLAAS